MTKILLSALFIFSAALAAAVEIPFTAENPDTVKGLRPIRVGIPFPKGKFRNCDDFGVFSGNRRIPCAMEVLNRWPQDNSLRWISVAFRAELNGEKLQKFTLRTGVKPMPSQGPAPKIVDLPGKLYFIHADGRRFDAAKPDVDEMVESTPERAMRRMEGWFQDAEGYKLCRYLTRTVKCSGSPDTLFYFTFLLTGDEKECRFQDIGVTFPGKYKTGVFGGVPGNAMNAYLLQYQYDKFLVGSVKAPKVFQEKGDGRRAPGWAAAGKLRVAVEDFAETFPNELEIRPDALTYHFWPAHGVADPKRKVTDQNRQFLWFCHEGKILDFKAPREYWDVGNSYQARYFREGAIESPMGVAKTAVLRISPEAGAAAPEAPITALPDPVWFCSSGVMRRIHPYDPERFPELEKYLYDRYALERRLSGSDHGKWNYGDGHTGWVAEKQSWDPMYRVWKGYHHSSGSLPYLLALRKGDFDIFRRAVAVTRHLLDVDICNYSTPESEKPLPEGSKFQWRRKIKGALCDYKGLTHWHAGSRNPDYNSQTEFALLYYFLTGDVRGMDVAKMWGEASLKCTRRGSSGRPGTGSVGALTDLWLGTGDSRYLTPAQKHIARIGKDQIKGARRLSSSDGPGSLTGWANYQPGIQKYYDATGDEEARKILKEWAFAAVRGETQRQRFSSVDLPVYAWLFTGDPAYLRVAKWMQESGVYSHWVSSKRSFSSVEYFHMERIPFYEWAIVNCGKAVTPLAVGTGCCEFPYLPDDSYPKSGSFTVFLKGEGKPFTLAGGFFTGDKKPRTVTLIRADGSKKWNKEVKPDKRGQYDFSENFEGLPAGVYALKIGPKVRRLALRCRLKQAAPLGGCHYQDVSSGAAWCFRVKRPGTLKVRAAKTMDYPLHLQLLDAAGNDLGLLHYLPLKDGERKEWSFKVTPGLLMLRGHFGTAKVALELDGNPVRYVSPSPELWFDMEKQ